MGEGTSAVVATSAGASGIPLIGQGAADPIFGTATVPGGGTGATTLTVHGVLVGEGTSAVVATSAGASGIPLIGQGAADPIFGTATVPGGGTGLTTLTAYAVLTGGTTATGNLQQVSGLGSSGQVLTSAGASALPTWSNPVVQTAKVTLTTGNVTSLNATPIPIIAAQGAGTVIFVINAFIKNNFVTTAFTSATGTIDLIYAGGSANPIITGLGSNAFVTAGAINVMGAVNGGQTNTAYSSLNNTAVQVTNPGAAFTGGGTSTIDVVVNYVVLTV